MNERDIRAVENMARTGMSFDELRKAFKEFSIEDVEKIQGDDRIRMIRIR